MVFLLSKRAAKKFNSIAKIEHKLHPWIAFFIIPVFALANAGVTIADLDILSALLSPVSLGIILGLFIGKQMGILHFHFWL